MAELTIEDDDDNLLHYPDVETLYWKIDTEGVEYFFVEYCSRIEDIRVGGAPLPKDIVDAAALFRQSHRVLSAWHEGLEDW